MKLSHVNAAGKAIMVDISAKPRVKRIAIAAGNIVLQTKTIGLLKKGLLKKGDALAAARIAGISAAKRTWEIIPLCHNISIDSVSVDFKFTRNGINISSQAICVDKTGIEMEALTAVAVAALTIYDMCKAVDKKMKIQNIRLVKKTKEEISPTIHPANGYPLFKKRG